MCLLIAVILGSSRTSSFNQNDRNSWSTSRGPVSIGEGVALISVGVVRETTSLGSPLTGERGVLV